MEKTSTLIIDAFWVDNKPFPTEQTSDTKAGLILHEGYSGDATHLGWMDMVQLRDILKKDPSISHIILKNLDLLGRATMVDGLVKVCKSYIYKKYHIINGIKENIDIKDLVPMYELVEVGGWNFSQDAEEIPFRAKMYMAYLLRHTDVKTISYSSNKVRVTAYFDDMHNVNFRNEVIS